ncbi:MAG: hypothetical protein LBS68_02335, partial [Puniceicoccales bacterium]|nr:hypothetical protein [Puniceicoccales bacterium]
TIPNALSDSYVAGHKPILELKSSRKGKNVSLAEELKDPAKNIESDRKKVLICVGNSMGETRAAAIAAR